MTGAIFLDRDGVINRKPPDGEYVRVWTEFEFIPGAIDALVHLSHRGRGPVIVVTNQRGIARGLVTEEQLEDIHRRMRSELADHGVVLGGIHVCPHEIGTCTCRKPEVGLFLAAVRDDPSIDLEQSAVVGDSISDLEAGRRLGADVYAVAPDPARLVALAAGNGIRVAGAASSLGDLVRTGALDAPGAGSPRG